MSTNRIRILCVDDHAFLVEGLKQRLSGESDLEYVGRLASADDLVPEVERLRPDVILLDIEMPGLDPFEAARDVSQRFPRSRIVVLSAYVRDRYLSAAADAGCWGYFSKSDDVRTVIDGIRRVAGGKFTLGPKVAERCKPAAGAKRGPAADSPAASRLDSLTPREQEILRLIGRGLSRVEIAEMLHRSPKTVDGHRERIMKKLKIHSGPELVRFAIAEGLAEV